jgi:hypothetical protein
LQLLVHPIAVGNGQPCPDPSLRPTGSETFETGVLNLTFEPAN